MTLESGGPEESGIEVGREEDWAVTLSYTDVLRAIHARALLLPTSDSKNNEAAAQQGAAFDVDRTGAPRTTVHTLGLRVVITCREIKGADGEPPREKWEGAAHDTTTAPAAQDIFTMRKVLLSLRPMNHPINDDQV